MATLTGSCLCETVTFEVEDDFEHFQLCHCLQCQKSTGTAHASNLFTTPAHLRWLSGESAIERFDVEGRSISNTFCRHCGSRVPWQSLSGEVMVIPAGCLDGAPSIRPKGHIFWPERAAWYDDVAALETHDTFMD